MSNESIVILVPDVETNMLVGCSGGVGSFGGTASASTSK